MRETNKNERNALRTAFLEQHFQLLRLLHHMMIIEKNTRQALNIAIRFVVYVPARRRRARDCSSAYSTRRPAEPNDDRLALGDKQRCVSSFGTMLFRSDLFCFASVIDDSI